MARSGAGDRVIHRRSAYQPESAQEYFIVHGLRDGIEAALKEFVAPLGPRRSVLDFGCGEQPLRRVLEDMGLRYTAADIQQNRAESVDFVLAVEEPIPRRLVEQGPFEVIVCTEVLEHVADWDWAFRSLMSVLAPGGIVLVTCPHFYPLHETPHDYWRPTPFALQYFGRRYGLSVLRQDTIGDGFDVLGTAFACLRPESRTGGPGSRLAAVVCDIARKAGFVLVRSRLLRRLVAGRSAVYLSNLVVFHRSEAHTSLQLTGVEPETSR